MLPDVELKYATPLSTVLLVFMCGLAGPLVVKLLTCYVGLNSFRALESTDTTDDTQWSVTQKKSLTPSPTATTNTVILISSLTLTNKRPLSAQLIVIYLISSSKH